MRVSLCWGRPQCERARLRQQETPWPSSPPSPLLPVPSPPGQRCQDLLVQLYLQRPELRVHAPEVLLRSVGATASSICKVSRRPARCVGCF